MKSGWVTKKLGEVCELINGKNQSEVSDPTGKYPIYGSGGVMGRARDYRCPAGCTIIGRKGSINNPIFVNEKFWNVDTAYALSPKDVNEKWLFYFCRSFDFSALDCGTTIPSLTSTLVKNIDIPIPPLAEQKRIVAKIDAAFEKIDKLKANAERNLANAKELFQSALDEAMRPKPGWVEKRLGEVCEVQLGKMLDKAKNKGKPYPYLANLSVRWRSFDLSNLRTMPFMDSEVEKFSLRPGDVLMCEGGEPGRCAIWKIPDSIIKFQKAIHRIRTQGLILPEYIVAFFESVVSTVEFQLRLTGTTIKHLPRERLIDISIPLPSLDEQKHIIKQLDALSQKTEILQQNYARQIADCAEMRQAILREAFEGRL